MLPQIISDLVRKAERAVEALTAKLRVIEANANYNDGAVSACCPAILDIARCACRPCSLWFRVRPVTLEPVVRHYSAPADLEPVALGIFGAVACCSWEVGLHEGRTRKRLLRFLFAGLGCRCWMLHGSPPLRSVSVFASGLGFQSRGDERHTSWLVCVAGRQRSLTKIQTRTRRLGRRPAGLGPRRRPSTRAMSWRAPPRRTQAPGRGRPRPLEGRLPTPARGMVAW
jgi:hypothetical protein